MGAVGDNGSLLSGRGLTNNKGNHNHIESELNMSHVVNGIKTLFVKKTKPQKTKLFCCFRESS